jgi:class 3 adenylate cyclase
MSVPAVAEAVEGTLVFTDIVGFTEYTELRGDAEALQLLAKQERLVRETLPEGARVVKDMGDGLLIWFRDACDALRTVLELQQRFDEESSTSGTPLWVRVGVHSGRAALRGDDLVGHDVNVASRIVDVAGPGEVLCSETTVEAVDANLPDVAFEELGPVVMKGIPEPVRVYRAVPFPDGVWKAINDPDEELARAPRQSTGQ